MRGKGEEGESGGIVDGEFVTSRSMVVIAYRSDARTGLAVQNLK